MICKSKRTTVLLSAQNICANCGHEIEMELDGWIHLDWGKYCREEMTYDDNDRFFTETCECENPEPEKEVK